MVEVEPSFEDTVRRDKERGRMGEVTESLNYKEGLL